MSRIITRQIVVNVGMVGHLAEAEFMQVIGRDGYTSDVSQYPSNMPCEEYRNFRSYGLSPEEVAKAWLKYVGAKDEGPRLDFENGGLIVAGRVIWILPDEQYAKFHKHAADWTMPTKDYVKSVVNQYYILKDFQEKHNPVIAHVQGVDVRKSDVANGWGAYAGKLMIPEYTRNADGSYLIDEHGNKVPTGRQVEGIKINMNEVFKLEPPK